MAFEFNPKMPIYLQMMDIIQERIFNGTYRSASPMPSVRELAGEYSVNPNTVQRAFRELEDTGLIITHSTSGRTVTEDVALIKSEKLKRSSIIIRRMLEELEKNGVNKNEVLTLVEKELD